MDEYVWLSEEGYCGSGTGCDAEAVGGILGQVGDGQCAEGVYLKLTNTLEDCFNKVDISTLKLEKFCELLDRDVWGDRACMCTKMCRTVQGVRECDASRLKDIPFCECTKAEDGSIAPFDYSYGTKHGTCSNCMFDSNGQLMHDGYLDGEPNNIFTRGSCTRQDPSDVDKCVEWATCSPPDYDNDACDPARDSPQFNSMLCMDIEQPSNCYAVNFLELSGADPENNPRNEDNWCYEGIEERCTVDNYNTELAYTRAQAKGFDDMQYDEDFLVTEVAANGKAQKAGVTPDNCFILTVGGADVAGKSTDAVKKMINRQKRDFTIRLFCDHQSCG